MSERIELSSGKWLRIVGPASIRVLRGCIEVWGKQLRERDTIAIPRSRATVVLALEDSCLEVKVGEGGSYEVEPETRAPPEWSYAVEAITERLPEGGRVVVLGDVASGKSTFTLLLLNTLTSGGKKCAVIDTDLGQSDFGLPAVVSMSIATRPYPAMSLLPFTDGYFVGTVNPAGCVHRIILGVTKLIRRAEQEKVPFIIVVTDGWIRGWEAREYKISLIDAVRPDFVIALEAGTELEHILKPLSRSGIEIVRIPALRAPARDLAERKIFRENLYKRHFRNARTISLSLDSIAFSNSVLGSGFQLTRNSREVRELSSRLGVEPLYLEYSDDSVLVVLPKTCRGVRREQVEQVVREVLGEYQNIVVLREGEERGLLCGLYGTGEKFLGLGVIQEIDYRRREMKLLTPVKGEIHTIVVGRIKLDEYLSEEAKFDPHVPVL